LFLVGDSPQGLIGQLSPAQFATYVANRRAEGFNVLYFDAVAGNYTNGRTDGKAADGTAPFLTGTSVSTYDLSKPNPAYFAILDQFVNTVIANGMIPVVDPIETGLYPNSPSTSWMVNMRNNGTAKVNAFGRFLGARYAGKVLWLYGNDFETWRTVPNDDTLVMALRDGIKAADPTDLDTIELNYEVNGTYTATASRDDANWESRSALDGIYTYNPTYAKFLTEYAKTNAKPTFLLEGQYEGANFGVNRTVTTPFALRRQNWWASTSGTSGIFYSNYPFSAGAQYLQYSNATTGTRELGYMTSFLRNNGWQKLVPDTGHTFLTGGLGTYASTGDANTNSYATAAVSPDGVGIAYIPTARTITVNFNGFTNPTVRWLDPTTGTTTNATGGPFTGTRNLTTPGNHADGNNDWILVVRNG
jgi:hypothetical protein